MRLNKKGFYSLLVGVIVVLLAATIISVQFSSVRARQAENFERSVFDLKTGMFVSQYLLDKALADAVADCQQADCSINAGCVPAKFNAYAAAVLDKAEKEYGISCAAVTITSFASGSQVGVTLDCEKVFENFEASATKSVIFEKEGITTGSGVCAVKDSQSGTCDYPESADCT